MDYFRAHSFIPAWPYAVGLVAIISVWLFIRPKPTKIPIVGDAKHPNFMAALEEGCRKYPESCFQIPTRDIPTVIVPRKCLSTIAYAPEHRLSLGREVYERLMGRYTKMVKSDHLAEFVRGGLSKQLAGNVSLLQEDARWTISSQIGDCPEWKSLQLFPTMVKLVPLHIGRTFINSPLSREQEWIDLTLEYAISTVTIAAKMSSTHWSLRPFKAFFLPEIGKMSQQFKQASKLLFPVLEARLGGEARESKDLMQWIIKNYPKQKNDLTLHTRLQLEAVQAATYNLAFQLIHFFFDLLAHPEYIEPLRAEIQTVFDSCGGAWTPAALADLRKCDSFLKESQRLNPIGIVSVSRFALSKIDLPDGTTVPAGISVSAPAMTVNTDSSLWECPTQFDGYRFEKLRQSKGNEYKYQFSSISSSELNWGYGTHSCPGRHFASNQVKVIIAELLMKYDFRFEEGISDNETPKRPPNIFDGVRIMPNPGANIMIRSRDVDI
ncbi:hypothetical protein MGYG_03288 [Nannizzia gypsea CBS 118893]|uniref:Ent-kaurene oxidase n=1 Tax=Arthroderma gypseum (strain ATCC MYA-4604 / CBS 118893) TaxID=535722 RepID=E4UMT1_ARTGP|nr:hypothetical protein MGYG_03288 [Nannizzia gypsea CBS 118893]EFR00285.1 hypothetical protein MGYG_03288 [Nannizzia gypsea CBS 118893]